MRWTVVILLFAACDAAPPAPAPAASSAPSAAGSERATVVREERSPEGDMRLFSAVLSDLNGDGAPELVAGGFALEDEGRRSTVPAYTLRNGKWEPLAEASWSDGKGSTIRNVAVADLDGDGRDEVVALGRVGSSPHDARARLAILGLKGTTFEHRDETVWSSGKYSHGYGLAVGDIDGDGRPEIVTGGFSFDGERETGFVRVWTFATGKLGMVAEATLDGAGEPSMRVNGIAIGDVDGGTPEIVVAGRRGPLKSERLRADHSLRTEHGDLVVMALSGGALVTRARYAWRKGTTTRLRAVVIGDLDGDAHAEIVAAGQYDASGKPCLGLFTYRDGALALQHDASELELAGEIKHLFIDKARVITTSAAGAKPARQGQVEAWRLEGGKLIREAVVLSKNGDETRARAAVVVPGPDGPTVITVGHAQNSSEMLGQVLEWKLP